MFQYFYHTVDTTVHRICLNTVQYVPVKTPNIQIRYYLFTNTDRIQENKWEMAHALLLPSQLALRPPLPLFLS